MYARFAPRPASTLRSTTRLALQRSPSVISRRRRRGDEREYESVVALVADRLDRGRAEERLGGEQVVEAAHPLHAAVLAPGLARGLDDRPAADDVVGHDQRAGTRQLQRPLQVARVVGLVGVDENHVE